MVAIVVAHAGNGVIGRDGRLPWHLPTDLGRFRELTTGRAVVMGRKTFESLPDAFRPLPRRRNLVLSRSSGYRAEGAEVFGRLEDALAACDHDCFVIGGELTYRQALPLAERLYVTRVEGEPAGDARFPALDEDEWRVVERSDPLEENGHRFSFVTYERGEPPALYDLDAARTEEQRRYMAELEAAGICIFCAEHVERYHPEPIEHSGEHWYVTKNGYPYEGAVAHYLIVPHRHVTSFDELPPEAGAELWELKRWLKERLAPAAVATVERSGDMRLNGGSVAHLHTHFVALDSSPAKTVRFRVSARAAGKPDS